MSFVFETLQDRVPSRQAAGGEASLADIWGASRDAMIYVDNSLSRGAAVEEAYARRVAEIEKATGQRVPNPAIEAFRGMPTRDELGSMEAGEGRYEASKRRFQTRLSELAQAFPDAAETIGAARTIEDDAIAIAQEAEGRLDQTTQSRDGIGKWAALLGGGVAGAMRDPLQVGLLVVGGGPGAGRTVATRLLSAAGREALINAGGEAALQPLVQSWRKEAGLPSGFGEAMRNVAFSGALGGVFGAGGQAIGEGARALSRSQKVNQLAEGLRGKLPSRGEDILSNDAAILSERMTPIREALPAEARGAIDQMQAEAVAAAARPVDMPAEVHDAQVSEALRAVQSNSAPQFEPDPSQIGRIAELLASTEKAAKTAKPQTLTDFLITMGGVTDYQGELQSIGADQIKRRGKGSLVRADGRPLDDARLMAAEAGFFNDRYGTPDDAMARSTIADFLDLLDDDIRTGNVTADLADSGGRNADAARAGIERDVDELQRMVGPGLADADIVSALNRSAETGDDILDSWATLMERPVDAPATDAPPDILPGWEDADLDAMAARINDPQSGIDDPAQPPQFIADAANDLDIDLDGLPADTAIPFDGDTVSPDQLRDSLARSELYQNLVEACRA